MAWVLALEVALDLVVASVAVPVARSSLPPPCPRNPSDKGDGGPAALCGQPAQPWCLCFLHPYLHSPFLGLILPVSPQCQDMDSALLEFGSFFPFGLVIQLEWERCRLTLYLPSTEENPTRCLISCISLYIRTKLLHHRAATDPARSGQEPLNTLSTLLLPFIHLRVNLQ